MNHRKITAALSIAALMMLAVVTAGCTTTTNPSPTPTPVVQTTALAGNNTTLTSTAGFKVTFPSKYKYSQNGSTPLKLYVYLDPTKQETGLYIVTNTLSSILSPYSRDESKLSNATLDSLSTYYINQVKDYRDFKVIQNLTNGNLSGKPAKSFTFQATIPITYENQTTKNQTLQVQEMWTMNNGTGYLLAYRAPPSDFTKFVPEAQKIVDSFQLT